MDLSQNGQIEVEASSFFYQMSWPNGVSILLDHFYEQRNYLIRAEVKISFPNSKNPLAEVDHVTINSGRSRTTLINSLKQAYPADLFPKVNWDEMVKQICMDAFLFRRKGEPVEEVGNKPITEDAKRWQLWPFVPMKEPAIIFGDGDSGKSLICTALGVCIQYGISKWGVRPIQGNVLILDGETSAAEFNRRLKGMQPMFGLPKPPVLAYQFCYRPVVENVERLAQIIAEKDIATVIVDNVGALIPGSANDDDVARDFMNAFRELKVSALCIAHDIKHKQQGRKPMPFGSSFWHNRARQIFMAKKEQEVGSEEFIIALHHTKSNVGPKMRPMGFHVHWDDRRGTITIERSDDDVYSSPVLSKDIGWKERIAQLLKRRVMTVAEIAEELDGDPSTIQSTQSTVRGTLNRGRGKKFIRVSEGWGLLIYPSVTST